MGIKRTSLPESVMINKSVADFLKMNDEDYERLYKEADETEKYINSVLDSVDENFSAETFRNKKQTAEFFNKLMILKDLTTKMNRLNCSLCAYVTMIQNGDESRSFSPLVSYHIDTYKFHNSQLAMFNLMQQKIIKQLNPKHL